MFFCHCSITTQYEMYYNTVCNVMYYNTVCNVSVCSEAVVAQVLDELGLQMADQLSGKYSTDFRCKRAVSFIRAVYLF